MKTKFTTIRTCVQIIYTIITNGYMYGYTHGTIYKGAWKYVCVPGLNCYSCPGAFASCPLGALQAALNQRGFTVPFAVLGMLFIFGSILGRFVCGWLCPFGLIQDLLYRIPFFYKRKQLPFHKVFRCLKYGVLVGLVFLGSAFLWGGYVKLPAFCKYLCPSGTLMGAIPLMATNDALRTQAGGLFFWKLGILILIILASILIFRPFCQYLCPLGAIYGWFNRWSLVQIQWEQDACTDCHACQKACPVNLTPDKISKSPECIRCGSCVQACPQQCLHFGKKKKERCMRRRNEV